MRHESNCPTQNCDCDDCLYSCDAMPCMCTTLEEVYRHILDAIHAGGNIFYDKDRFAAYALISRLASDYRQSQRIKTPS